MKVIEFTDAQKEELKTLVENCNSAKFLSEQMSNYILSIMQEAAKEYRKTHSQLWDKLNSMFPETQDGKWALEGHKLDDMRLIEKD